MIKGNVKIDRKNLISILQSCLALILVILVALMMVEIGNLKGTARVINYAGLVRGATQRAVKLEITGTRNDELIAYLDDILSDLTSGDGHYELESSRTRPIRKGWTSSVPTGSGSRRRSRRPDSVDMRTPKSLP